MFGFKDGPWYDNFIHKIRLIIDDVYPWGKTKRDLRFSGGTGAQALES